MVVTARVWGVWVLVTGASGVRARDGVCAMTRKIFFLVGWQAVNSSARADRLRFE